MSIKRYTAFLPVLICLCSLVQAAVLADMVHVSYDGRPIAYHRGEKTRYVTLINEAPFDAHVRMTVSDLVNISTDNAYVRQHSAAEWVHLSERECVLAPYTRKHIAVEINPYPFLSRKEYYAQLDVSASLQTITLPLVIRLDEPEVLPGDPMQVRVGRENQDECVISYRNTGEFMQTVDIQLYAGHPSVLPVNVIPVNDSMLVLPGETFLKRYRVPEDARGFVIFVRDKQYEHREDIR